ncbi:hypothetical protein JCM3765_006073 [Sporobolomyces pararoseus]
MGKTKARTVPAVASRPRVQPIPSGADKGLEGTDQEFRARYKNPKDSSRPGEQEAVRVEIDELTGIEWQQGEPLETIKFPEGGPEGALKYFNLSLSSTGADLNRALEQALTDHRRRQEREGKLSSLESRGATYYLACACSKPGDELLKGLVAQMLIPEANRLLSERQLPLPRGVKHEDLFIPSGYATSKIVSQDEGQWHRAVKSSKESRLYKAEMRTKDLQSENSELKSNLSALKAEVKEAYQARDRKEEENSELVKQISEAKVEHKEKVEKLREENTKLKSELSPLLVVNLLVADTVFLRLRYHPTSSPTSSSSSKSSFVVRALGKQVKDLSRELKEKNDQLAELITELTKSG